MEEDTLKGKKSLEYSIKDGTAFSVMTGFGEQYFSPLAIELGASNPEIGLLASIPQFVAALMQLYTSKLTAYLGSRKKTILIFVMLQALIWVPLILLPISGLMYSILILILLVSLYFVFGQFIVPVWNSLIGDLVPENMRGRFFGLRNKITGATAFFSVLAAGLILGLFPKEEILYGFTLIFAVAFVARLVSWHYLSKSDDPSMDHGGEEEFSFIQYIRRLRETNYGRFALYFSLMNFSVYIAAPFFAVYMLRDLHMGYFEYTIVTAAAAFMTFLPMTYWGKLADRFGNKRILSFSGMLLPIVPILWLFSSDTVYLILIQIFSGFVWAGFNLSSINLVYDNVKPENRTKVFAYHNVLNGSSIFMGSMIGSALALALTTPGIFQSALQMLFLISGILRLIMSLIFLPKITEKRRVEEISEKDFFLKYNGTGPIIGLTYRAVTGLGKTLKTRRERSEPGT